MKSFFKHAGLFIAGAGCIVGGLFFPPAAMLLGPLGTKLIVAAGAATLLGTDAPTIVAGIKSAVTKKAP